MATMIDTMVLVYAIRHGLGDLREDDDEDSARLELSRGLIQNFDAFRLSTISFFEFQRGNKDPRQQQMLAEWSSRMLLISVSPPIAKFAAELSSKQGGAVCKKCFGTGKASPPCAACKQPKSRQQKCNDILIVATAEKSPGVSVLHTFDTGILALGELDMVTVEIKRPPPFQPDLPKIEEGPAEQPVDGPE